MDHVDLCLDLASLSERVSPYVFSDHNGGMGTLRGGMNVPLRVLSRDAIGYLTRTACRLIVYGLCRVVHGFVALWVKGLVSFRGSGR